MNEILLQLNLKIFSIIFLIVKRSVVILFPLFSKYVGLTVLQLGVTSWLRAWMFVLCRFAWKMILQRINSVCRKKAVVSLLLFGIADILVSLAFVPPQNNPIDVTHCQVVNFEETVDTLHLLQNSNHTISPLFNFTQNFQLNYVNSTNKANHKYLKKVLQSPADMPTTNADKDYLKMLNYIPMLNDRIKESKSSFSINKKNKTVEKTIKAIQMGKNTVIAKSKNLTSGNNGPFIHGNFQLVNKNSTIIFSTNKSSVEKEVYHRKLNEKMIVSNFSHKLHYHNTSPFKKYQHNLKDHNIKLDNRKYKKKQFHQKSRNYMFPNLNSKYINESQTYYGIMPYNNSRSENKTSLIHSKANMSKNMIDQRTQKSMLNRKLLSLLDTSTSDPFEKVQILKSIDNSLNNSYTISTFQQIFSSNTFLQVLFLAILLESFFSGVIIPYNMHSSNQGEIEDDVELISKSIISLLLWALVVSPIIALLTLVETCPYQIRVFLFISGVLTVVSLFIFSCFLTSTPMFRSRKNSKPSYNALSLNKLFKRSGSSPSMVISGCLMSCNSEFILWYMEDVLSIPINLIFIYLMYCSLSALVHAVIKMCLLREVVAHQDETSDDYWKQKSSIFDFLSCGAHFIQAVLIFCVQFISDLWPIAVLGVFQGICEAIFVPERLHSMWLVGYGLGCILYSVLAHIYGLIFAFKLFSATALVWTIVDTTVTCVKLLRIKRTRLYKRLAVQQSSDLILEGDDESEDWLERALLEDEYNHTKQLL